MDRTPKSDEWLMAQVASGARDQLEPLVRRYASPLLSFIRNMIRDADRSEELFQEVFVAVWRKRSSYLSAGRFKPWLYAIAVNKVREHLRNRGTSFYLSLDADGPEPESHVSSHAVDTLVSAETATAVAEAVATLPVKQRAVVVLRVWSGMSYADIADILNRSEATVRANMHHGLANLRSYLEPRLR